MMNQIKENPSRITYERGRPGQRKAGGPNASDWLGPYANMATILLIFFVLLFSMSGMDISRLGMAAQARSGFITDEGEIIIFAASDGTLKNQIAYPNNETESPIRANTLEGIYNQLVRHILESQIQGQAEIFNGGDYIFIRIMDEMLFLPNSARLRSPNMEILNLLGYGIKNVEDHIGMISIHGHTDDLPDNPGYAVSSRRLSTDRANEILEYLESNTGVDPAKLISVGWGSQRPLQGGTLPGGFDITPQDRSQNRRVEIMITLDNTIGHTLDDIYTNFR